MALLSCSDDTPPAGDAGSDGGADADVGDREVGSDTPGEALEITDLIVTENIWSVLSAIVEVETDAASSVTIVVEEVATGARIEVPATGFATEHEVGVIGMKAETEYTVTVTAETEAGAVAVADPEPYTTRELPDDFPHLQVITADPERMSPGYTLFQVNRWTPSLDQNYGWIIAVDNAGDVVWYNRPGIPIMGTVHLDNGNSLYIAGVNAAREIDPLGNEATFWFAPNIGIESIHHHISELSNGNILVTGSELRTIDGFPAEEGTMSYNIVADTIHEVTREGDLVSTISLFDLFDPLDIPEDLTDPFYDSFDDPFWDFLYGGGTKDWTHLNEVIVDDDGNYIISVRHLNLIAKIDPSDPENPVVLWRMGPGHDFELVGDGLWHYHQHGPDLQDDGSILVYDNGNHRDGVVRGPELFTRVVQYAIDEEAMEVEQLWEYRGESPYFASFVGNVSGLANGNVLINDGGILSDPNLRETDPDGGRWARIVEVTRDEEPEVLFTLEVRDPDAVVGYHVYQSHRFESLY